MKIFTKSILLTIFLIVTSYCSAQNHLILHGNVGVENVNIQVVDTEYGTSSDLNGNYIMPLFKAGHKIMLFYSCVGYEDTLVVITPKQMLTDSLRISFKMKKTTYMLEAASISAEKVTRYSEQKYVLMDFENYDDNFLILQRKEDSYKDYRILITNILFDALDTIQFNCNTVPVLFKDCLGNCQIGSNDSVYQVLKYNNDYVLGYAVEKNHFKKIMSNCLFITNKWAYFKNTDNTGFNNTFYRINTKDHHNEIIFKSTDPKSQKEIRDEIKFYAAHPIVYNGITHGPTVDEWAVFVKHAWYHPRSPYLGRIADTLYYFDHVNYVIQAYDEELNLLNSCDITYPKDEDFWRFNIYQDEATNKFYTIFGTQLNEIDVKTGKTYPKANANSFLNQKIIIYKGNLYTLKRRMDSGGIWISYIEREKII